MDSSAPNTAESSSLPASKDKYKIFWRVLWIILIIRFGWKIVGGDFDKIMPWKYQSMSSLVQEATKTKLVSTSEKLNKLITLVEADEAKLNDKSITQKPDTSSILEKRQEISLLYQEVQNTIVKDSGFMKKTLKSGAFLDQYIGIYGGLTKSADNAKTINSKLTRFDPNQSIYLGSRN